MKHDTPIPYRWMERHCPECGTVLEPALIPHRRWWDRCRQAFKLGADYIMLAYTPSDQRSQAEHNRYFAELHELYVNLPESEPWASETEDNVRKLALIATGWKRTQVYSFHTKREALRMKPIILEIVRRHEACEITVSGTQIMVHTARSQKMLPSPEGMNKHDFRASSEAVLDVLRTRVGVTAEASQSAAAAGANA